VVEECSIELLNDRERYWQEFYNCIGKNGLNCRLTKTTDKSGFFCDETKQKMSTVGKTHLAKIEKLKASRHDWTGKKHSPETKEKMRLAAIGIPKTKEHIAKLPQNQKGKFRAKDSEETKMKKLLSNPKTRKVNQMTLDGKFIKEWNGIEYASKELGISRCGISDCCTKKIEKSNSFIWRFKDNPLENNFILSPNGFYRPVLQYDIDGGFIKEWYNIQEASINLGIKHYNISNCCFGRIKSTGNYKFKYKN